MSAVNPPKTTSPSADGSPDRRGTTAPHAKEDQNVSQQPKTNPVASDHEANKPEAPEAGISGDAIVPAPAEADARDPFDLSKIAVSGVLSEDLGVAKPILVIPVDKPNRQSFFRVHPDPTYRADVRIIKLEAARETYLVTNEVWPEIPGETKFVRLIPYITREGGLGLWPVPLPDDYLGKKDTNWGITARAAAEYAEAKWVRMQANMQLGRYDVATSDKIPDPVWPTITFREILEKAFGKDHLIDSLEHPVIRQLQGDV